MADFIDPTVKLCYTIVDLLEAHVHIESKREMAQIVAEVLAGLSECHRSELTAWAVDEGVLRQEAWYSDRCWNDHNGMRRTGELRFVEEEVPEPPFTPLYRVRTFHEQVTE